MNCIKRITLILLLIVALAGVATNQQATNRHEACLRALTRTLDLPSILPACGIITNGQGHGSCVAIDSDLILTAGHCIGHEGSWVEIGGVKYDILDEWRSEQYDIGFVRIDDQVPYLQLGEMPKLLDTVYFVGSPYEICFVNTITKGIISHLDRDVYDRIDLIQTDAEGAPGSSGCALVDIQGHIIGICVAGPNPGGGVTLCEPVSHILEALEEYNAAH